MDTSSAVLVFNVVVVYRTSFYDGWGLTLAGGPGSNVLPHISSISSALHQAAWLQGPLTVVCLHVSINVLTYDVKEANKSIDR